jgi:hypothetical protein
MLAKELVLSDPFACILAKNPKMSGSAVCKRLEAADELIPALCDIKLVT